MKVKVKYKSSPLLVFRYACALANQQLKYYAVSEAALKGKGKAQQRLTSF